jgi:hypothetical protein
MQFVDGVSATTSGLHTLPMVIGLLTMSMGSGVIVGRTGRYKISPVAGTASLKDEAGGECLLLAGVSIRPPLSDNRRTMPSAEEQLLLRPLRERLRIPRRCRRLTGLPDPECRDSVGQRPRRYGDRQFRRPFPVGLLCVVIDRRRRSLQDIVFRTRMVYSRPMAR